MSQKSTSQNLTVVRVLIALLGMPLTVCAIFFVRSSIIASSIRSLSFWDHGLTLAFLAASALCWWFVIGANSAKIRRLILHAVIGAGVVGGVSFALGFFGPIIIDPTANQGPFLGIFATGPLGFAIGALIGLVVGLFRV